MNKAIVFIAGLIILHWAQCDYFPISNSTQGRKCADSILFRLWRVGPSSKEYNCWSVSDTSEHCGDATVTLCTNLGEDHFPKDSKYFIVPQDEVCGMGTQYSNYNRQTIETKYVPEGGVWWIELRNYQKSSDSVKLDNLVSKNVDITVYNQISLNKYEYILGIDRNDTYEFKCKQYEAVWIMVKSKYTDRIGKFSIDFYSTKRKNEGLSTGIIVAIVLGSIVFLIALFFAIRFCINLRKRGKRNFSINNVNLKSEKLITNNQLENKSTSASQSIKVFFNQRSLLFFLF